MTNMDTSDIIEGVIMYALQGGGLHGSHTR